MHSKLNGDNYLACGECDLLLEAITVVDGFQAICPRCGHLLYRPIKDSINKTLLLSLTGLVLFIPANLLPIFHLNFLGEDRVVSVVSGILVLCQQQYWIVAAVVLLSSLLIPLIRLLSLLFLSFSLKYQRSSHYLGVIFRQYLLLTGWGMMEVYYLAAMVAAVKLHDMGHLSAGLGLYFFSGLLITTVLLSLVIDKKTFWHLIEQHNVL